MKSTGWRQLTTLGAALVLALGAAACEKSEASGDGEKAEKATAEASEGTTPAAGETATPVETETPATAAGETAETDGAETEGAAKGVEEAAPETDPAPRQTVVASEKTIKGDGTYTIKIKAPDSVAKGGSGTAMVTVTPGKGWKMNKEFPTKLKITPPSGVTVEKETLRIGDAVSWEEKKGVFAVKFKATSSGDKAFTGEFKFAVCTDATCDPKKAKLAWNVAAK